MAPRPTQSSEDEDADLLRAALAVADGSSAGDLGLSAETVDRLSGPLGALDILERLRSALAQSRDEPQIAPGTVVGHYEIGPLIAVGGMGEVYRARHLRLARDVAVKIVGRKSRFDPQAVARFQREARLAASISHPNLVTLHEIIEVDGRLCLVFEFLRGEPLSARLRNGPLPLEEALGVFEPMARGLSALHAGGVTHSDIKPANIFLCLSGETKLLDLGVARPVERSADETRTGYGLLGTPSYMPPERIQSSLHAPTGDVFSLGVVLFESLTGVHPFRGPDLESTLHAIINREPDTSALPGEIRTLVARCLEKAPGLRPSAAEVAHGLSEVRAGRAPRWLSRGRKTSRTVAIAVLAAVAVGLAGLGVSRRGATLPPATPAGPSPTPLAGPSPPTPEVHRLYLYAAGLVNDASPQAMSRALIGFEQVTKLAPDFAAGWASYANLLQMISAFMDGVDPATTQATAMAAARRALQLDPRNASAHQALADLLSQQNDWVGAERSILRALALDPTSAEVHHTYAVSVLAPTGRLDEAERASLRAVELQPSSGSYGEALGRMYYFKREFATALEQWSRVLMRRPGELSSMWRKGQAEMFLGRHKEALATFAAADALTPGISKGQTLIAMARAGAGDIQGARRIRDRLLAQQKQGRYVSPTLLGLIEVGLGDKDSAFGHLMNACHAHADWVRFAKVDPILDPLRSDPRFAELLRCLKLD